MAFTTKDWRDTPDLTTPITATALEDMEARLSSYTDTTIASSVAASVATPRFVDRGTVAPSTSYVPWDVVLYRGKRILITVAVTTGAGLEPFISATKYMKLGSEAVYHATDYGVVGDATSDNANALNALIYRVWSGAAQGRIILPFGYVLTSKTIVILPNVTLQGQGILGTQIKLTTGADCDVVQFSTKSSTSQATILSTATGTTVTAASIPNCFFGGLVDVSIHGNQAAQTPGTYNHGVNTTTNPLTTIGAGDPDFDPLNIVSNVFARTCTGDGFFHAGRSDVRYEDCVAKYNRGNGYSLTFDTFVSDCIAGANGLAGFYLDKSSTRYANCKSYNNGRTAPWVSARAYTISETVTDGGVMYAAKGSTSGATAPGSDPNNWAPVTPTSLAGYGTGYYATGCNEITYSGCDAQQNAGSGWHLKNTTGVAIQGTVQQTNTTPPGGTNAATNPSNYAALVLEGAKGTVANLTANLLAPAGYALRIVNGTGAPSANDISIVGDSTAAAVLSADSIALSRTTNMVRYNGAFLGSVMLGASGPNITSGAGSPEGVVTGSVGDLFLRTDGGATTTLYVKTSGSGNTGWTAK